MPKAIASGLSFGPFADTVSATLECFRSQPEERQAEVRAGISAEREAEALAAWREFSSQRSSGFEIPLTVGLSDHLD